MAAEGEADPDGAARGARTPGVIRDGTAQPGRFPAPLRDGFFSVDETTLADLISMSARIARNLRFDPEPESEESWADLYTAEPVFVLAEIESFRVGPRLMRMDELRAARDEVSLAGIVRHLASQLIYWRSVLATSEHPGIGVLTRRIDRTVRDLESDTEAGIFFLAERDFPEWVPYADFGAGTPAADSARGDAERARLVVRFHGAGQRILGAIAHLAAEHRGLLDEVLRSKRHDPALGLSLAFLRLFGRAQETLNELTRRRLEFYYFDVLGFEPSRRVPDWAHLALAPAPGTAELVVPAATEFLAGRDERKADLVFVSEHDVRVTDARVESLRTLFFDRDPLVSPERELGFVTGIRAQQVDREGLPTDGAGDQPVLAADPADGYAGAEQAELGFAVASPLLHLAEGKRRIRFDMELGLLDFVPRPAPAQGGAASPAAAGTPDPDVAIERLRGCGSAPELFDELGRIFTNELMSETAWLSRGPDGEDRVAAIREAVASVLALDPIDRGDSESVIGLLFERDRTALFYELFRRSLTVRFTAAGGWQEVPHRFIGPLDRVGGLAIVLELGPEAPAVVGYDPDVHGAGYDTELPTVRFRVGADAIFHPYSILRALPLQRIDLEVRVEGVTDLVAYNRIGPLDPSKPFQPFGPLPTRSSELVLGSYEAARKSLSEAWLDIEWGDLPREAGGWRTHYHGYDTEYADDTFQVDVAVCRDRRWLPGEEERPDSAPLFTTRDQDGALDRHHSVAVDVLGYYKPLSPGTSEQDFRSAPKDRNGLVRLSLEPSHADFGHRAYPSLLTRAVQANAKRKKPEPEPRPPYTPVIDRLALSYVARGSIVLGKSYAGLDERARGRIFHDHPFGARDLTRASFDERFALMPAGPEPPGALGEAIRHDGYLFIGLSGTAPAGRLSLLTHMVSSATQSDAAGATRPSWYYLASNRWRRLPPDRVVDDTTSGFQTSGLVTLDVPPDIDRENTVLPNDLYWLAVGAENLEAAVLRLHSVWTGGVRVQWDDRENVRPHGRTGLPPGTIKGTLAPFAGLGGVTQVGPTLGGRPAEDYERVVTRASERLRHKNRAVTPWDYERLVLERFPSVYKAKCFAHTDVERYPEAAPGHVLLVVVPRLAAPSRSEWRMRGHSGSDLAEIREALREVAPLAARISVRNPTWEVVQVRCQVKLVESARSGQSLQALNQALIDFVAPWARGGRGGRFGWTIREKDVAAHVHALPFIEFVTDLSLLHISADQRAPNRFHRRDTALLLEESAVVALAGEAAGRPANLSVDALGRPIPDHEVRGRYPWSLGMPSPRHYILTTDRAVDTEARITGIGELEVGQDFILEPESE